MRFAGSSTGKDSAGNTLRSFYAKHGKLICLFIGIVSGVLVAGLFMKRDGASVHIPVTSVSEVTIAKSINPATEMEVNGAAYSKEEEAFLTTFRSCLRKNCFDDAVKLKTQNQQIVRIGLLIPDLIGAQSLLKMFNSIGMFAQKGIEIIVDSNVPAYGYGKNHGWSKIIRIAQDIVPQAYSLLHTKYPRDEKLVSDLYEAQLKQLMRWHCRLSHVAAHTSLLTVFTDDFLQRPVASLDEIVSFIGLKASRDSLLNAIDINLPALQREWKVNTIPSNFHGKAASIIADEMSNTDNLTKWPCKLFSRDLGLTGEQSHTMLPLPVHTLFANCSEEYVICSVPYDVHAHNEYLESIDRR